MAKAKLESYLTSMSGRLNDMVYYNIGKKTYVRKYVVPQNPKSEQQQSNRSLFAEAMAMWKTLCENDKQQYRKKARKLPMHGHNLFISQYIKLHKDERASGIKAIQSAEPLSRHVTALDIIQQDDYSEASPYQLRIYYNSASIESIYSLYSVPV